MDSPGVERSLAAILHADAVGYSRLMAADDAGTIQAIMAAREQIGRVVGEHRGRVVDSPGDAVLAELPSARDAVEAAVEIQSALGTLNAPLPENRRMPFRIGVHLGDIAREGDRVYGDGVNIAARLEGLAQPGGICISAEVHTQVRDRLGLRYRDLGEQAVKNIPRPLRVYRILLDPDEQAVQPAPTHPERRVAAVVGMLATAGLVGWLLFADRTPTKLATGQAHSLAVLPLDDLSGDAAQEYFTAGMTEALISNLAKLASLDVVSRTSVLQYRGTRKSMAEIARELGVDTVLEGSVLRAGESVRITVQLIDARTDRHLWTQSYERDLRDVLALQREVAEAVAHEIQLQLTPEARERMPRTNRVDPAATARQR